MPIRSKGVPTAEISDFSVRTNDFGVTNDILEIPGQSQNVQLRKRGRPKIKIGLGDGEKASKETYEPKFNVSTDTDTANILLEGSKRQAKRSVFYANLLNKNRDLQPYFAAFLSSAVTINRIYISQLPAEPRNWKELNTHPKGKEFRLGAIKEVKKLYDKGT